MGLHRRTKVEQLRERDLMMPQEVRQMPEDKMVIMAEGQGPIFADKLRFFQTPPFREMERFSQVNLPDVPTTEYLPQRAVPATTPAYTGEDADALNPGEKEAKPEEKTKRPGQKSIARPTTEAGGRNSRRSAAVAGETFPRASISAKSTPGVLDARFAKAARRLQALAKAPDRSENQPGKANNWARVFDETVPDELEIAEAEAG